MSDQKKVIEVGGLVFGNINPAQETMLTGRDVFVEQYCKEKGWDRENISIDQLMEIRAQEGWKNPT
jgi:hypothetical protein